MKLKIRNILLAAALVVIIAGVASQIRIRKVSGQAATPESVAAYTLNIRRSFGYSAGGNIRGSFRLAVNGPQENISKVVFLLDRQPIGEVTEPPFQLDIHTQDYPEGSHTLSAEVTTLDGSVQMAPGGTFNFVSASRSMGGGVQYRCCHWRDPVAGRWTWFSLHIPHNRQDRKGSAAWFGTALWHPGWGRVLPLWKTVRIPLVGTEPGRFKI